MNERTEALDRPGSEKPTVFLSHSTADRSLVEWIAAQAGAMGISCYVAENDPQPGALLSSKVRMAIDRSDALLALLTEAGNSSKYVHQEIGAAVQTDKPVLALVDQCLGSETFAMLAGVEQIRFNPADLSSASADLISGLRVLGERRGVPPGPVLVTVQPALQVQFAAQLNLTGGQVMVGLLVVAAVVGLVYLASQSGPASPALGITT